MHVAGQERGGLGSGSAEAEAMEHDQTEADDEGEESSGDTGASMDELARLTTRSRAVEPTSSRVG